MIRQILAVLEAVIFLLIGYIELGILWIIGKFNKNLEKKIEFARVQWIFKVITATLGVKLDVKGLENVPKDEPVLYVANHNTIFDVVLTYHLCPGITGYIAKDSLKKVPGLNLWMARNYCLFLDRKDIRQGMQVILQAIDYIKNDKVSMFVFPEGTRSKDGNLGEFKDGSLKMASKTGAKVVPVAIIGSKGCAGTFRPFWKTKNVEIIYGEPVDMGQLEGEDKKHPGAYFRSIIGDMLH